MIHELRKRTAAPLAAMARTALRSTILPPGAKRRIWALAERHVSFFGVRAQATTTAGHLMDVKTSAMVEKQIYYFGEWEPGFSRYLIDNPRKDRIFLDLGANIGYFTILASGLYDQVIAIEASPSIFQRLKANVDRNRIANATLINVAVGDAAGTARFYLNPDHSGSSSLIEGEGRALESEVRVLPLFDILPEGSVARIGMIKVDVEGFEHIVLRQILDRLADLPPDLKLLVEYGPERAGNLAEIFRDLRAAGFGARLMQGPYSIDEYVTPAARSSLPVLTAPPTEFSDVLFERG